MKVSFQCKHYSELCNNLFSYYDTLKHIYILSYIMMKVDDQTGKIYIENPKLHYKDDIARHKK